MKKRNLLTMALAGLTLSSVSAAEFPIIEDGKLAGGIELIEHEGAGDQIEFGVTCPGGGSAALYTTAAKYSNVRFYAKDKALDLGANWIVEVEYYYDEKNEDGKDNVPEEYLASKWNIITFGVAEDTVGGVFSPQVEADIDGKFEGNVFRGNAGKVCKDSAYIFTRADKFLNGAKLLTFSFCDQITTPEGLEDISEYRGQQLYIKNLKVVSNGNKPFYAENFQCDGATAWTEAHAGFEKYILDTKGGTNEISITTAATKKQNSAWKGGLALTSDNNGTKKQSHCGLFRSYEANGVDGSLKYYDTEILHALAMPKANVSSSYIWGIPVEAIAGKDITIDFISKWKANETAEGLTAETEDALRKLPVYVIFDGKIDEAIDLDYLINGMWSAYSKTITIPAGTKTMSIKFAPNDNFSYLVDNLFLTVADGSYKLGNFAEDALDPTDVVPGAVEKVVLLDHVASIANDANASAYFDGDNFIVKADEEIASISIIDMAGKTASVNGGEFNVSGFNKGIYVFVAKTVNGVSISGKIIIE